MINQNLLNSALVGENVDSIAIELIKIYISFKSTILACTKVTQQSSISLQFYWVC